MIADCALGLFLVLYVVAMGFIFKELFSALFGGIP